MNHYSLTLNPSPFNKWDLLSVNTFFSTGKIYAKQYERLPIDVQEELLNNIMHYFMQQVPAKYSKFNFETTKRGNKHIHCHFETNDEIETFQRHIDKINSVFSNADKWKAIYIEKTHTTKEPWHKYESKDRYLNVLMDLKLPAHDFQ